MTGQTCQDETAASSNGGGGGAGVWGRRAPELQTETEKQEEKMETACPEYV